MNFTDYVADRLLESKWCEITEEEIRTNHDPEFVATRGSLNGIAKELTGVSPVFASVETYGHAATGEHLKTTLIVAYNIDDS